MTLLITLIAAVIVTIVWYTSPKARKLKVGLMCYMYWGASIMWLVDALFEYKEQGAGYFTPATADMINDSFFRNLRCCTRHRRMARHYAHKRP